MQPIERARLAAALPSERLFFDAGDCLPYAYDNSRRMALPQAVALPIDEDEVVGLVRACRELRLPLTVRGRGTNTTGATVPIAGGVVVSMERMDRILSFSPGDRMIECQAGCTNGAVQRAAAAHGLFWAPDPTSAVTLPVNLLKTIAEPAASVATAKSVPVTVLTP